MCIRRVPEFVLNDLAHSSGLKRDAAETGICRRVSYSR